IYLFNFILFSFSFFGLSIAEEELLFSLKFLFFSVSVINLLLYNSAIIASERSILLILIFLWVIIITGVSFFRFFGL
ncbi:MAG TPA: hypothetical protein PLH49_09270, partial [Chitinophagaceae bacterium]|nr:hypothetical protein [Chitinophagaceae bacterium]